MRTQLRQVRSGAIRTSGALKEHEQKLLSQELATELDHIDLTDEKAVHTFAVYGCRDRERVAFNLVER